MSNGMFDHVYSLDDIRRHPILEPEWIVDGWIGKADATICFGNWGSGKTYLLFYLALCLGSGQHFLGRSLKQSRVLFIDKEMPLNGANYRLNMLLKGCPSLYSEHVSYISQPLISMNYNNGKRLAEFAGDYDVVIIDSLRSVLVGDEKQAENIRLFWNSLLPLKTNGCTVIVTHHMNKENTQHPQKLADRSSGSTDISAGADSVIAIECDEEQPNSMQGKLTHLKTRWDGKQAPLSYTAKWATGQWSRYFV